MPLNITAPENIVLKPVITVFGVGGAGGNAVNNMIASGLAGANFVIANTDAQALAASACENKIQLGVKSTKGLGAGAKPNVGQEAAEESETEIRSMLENSNMLFVTAGMGGGTGTGAAPVVARIAKELGILTVGVVTKPFLFEGPGRMRLAEEGLAKLQQHVDTLIVIPNQNLFRIANEDTTFDDAFKMADDVLHAGVRGVTDLITIPGLINLDFADIKTVMNEMGKAMMGTGVGEGEDRAIKAAEAAISNPLLDHSSMCGAKSVLINITGGSDMKLYEVDSAANRIRQEVGDPNANIIFGSAFKKDLDGKIMVSVVATGIDAESAVSVKMGAADSVSMSARKDAIIEDESIEIGSSATEDVHEIDEAEPPAFNEYEEIESEFLTDGEREEKMEGIAQNMDWTAESDLVEGFQSKQVASGAQEIKPKQSSKQSFLKRIWGALKAAEAGDSPSQSRSAQPISPAISSTSMSSTSRDSNVQEVPSLSRRK